MSTCFAFGGFFLHPTTLFLSELSPILLVEKYASLEYCSYVLIESKDHREVEMKVILEVTPSNLTTGKKSHLPVSET